MNKSDLNEQLQDLLKQVSRFKKVLFVVVLVIIYVFLFWRVTVLKNAQPSESDIATQSGPTTNIDQSTVNKINELQNNSVNVQALFNQARQNPFSE